MLQVSHQAYLCRHFEVGDMLFRTAEEDRTEVRYLEMGIYGSRREDGIWAL
jgi:hypothetical protein